jgi:NAD(P)-dependent dehydrogenase (short-subunit alcohol dehydrogenase family)
MRKVILVTGGNRGIGLQICKELADQGHSVIMGSRDEEKAKEIAAHAKGAISVIKLDVTDEADIRNATASIEENYGKLDVLINNAGIIGSRSGPMEVSPEELKSVMDSNLFGAWRLTQQLLPLLKKSNDARIIHVSSGKGSRSSLTGDHSAYSLSKYALNGLTLLMASELQGVAKVNTMCPGWVRTDMGGPNAHRSVEQGADTAVWLATAEKIPHGKFLRDRKEIDW